MEKDGIVTKEQALQIKTMYDFWYEPPILGMPNRAEQLDKVLLLTRGTTFMGKALMALFGLAVTMSALWTAIKAFAGNP
jgi:hypothetical protein